MMQLALRSLTVSAFLLGLACQSAQGALAFRVLSDQRNRKETDKRIRADTEEAIFKELESPASSVRVAVLGGHQGSSWSGDCGKTKGTDKQRALCNLNVYEEAAKTAQRSGVDLLLLPEYGLTAGSSSGYADAVPSVGDRPCGSNADNHAQVAGMSCLAEKYSVALSSNIISRAEGKTYITDVVFDKTGAVIAVYHKNDLFPGEGFWAYEGGFNPTVFELFGQKWALPICWEGMGPFVPLVGSWAQFDAFKRKGAQHILWSVGNTVIGGVLTGLAGNIAKRNEMTVFATMNTGILGPTTALVDARGDILAKTRVALDQDALAALGYGERPFLDIATV